jgi:hypothetical protein
MARQFTSYAASLPRIEVRPFSWTRRPAFFLDGREICHFHSPRELDLRLTRSVLRDLRLMIYGEPCLKPRPHKSDWVALTRRVTKTSSSRATSSISLITRLWVTSDWPTTKTSDGRNDGLQSYT